MSEQEMEYLNELRLQLAEAINKNPKSREDLEKKYGRVWDTEQLVSDFTVEAFAAPFVTVVRKRDATKGALLFQHSPRFYYNFKEV